MTIDERLHIIGEFIRRSDDEFDLETVLVSLFSFGSTSE